MTSSGSGDFFHIKRDFVIGLDARLANREHIVAKFAGGFQTKFDLDFIGLDIAQFLANLQGREPHRVERGVEGGFGLFDSVAQPGAGHAAFGGRGFNQQFGTVFEAVADELGYEGLQVSG